MNVPAGLLADHFPRRNLLVMGGLIKALCFVTWIVTQNYVGFALGFMLWGIGGAFSDGTLEAFIYDELKAARAESIYTKVLGRVNAIAQVSILAATALAALAIKLGYSFVLVASAVGVAISALLVVGLPKVRPIEEINEPKYIATLRSAFAEIFRRRSLLYIVLIGALIGTAFGVLEEYIPLLFKDFGYDRPAIAMLDACLGVASVAATYAAVQYERLRPLFLSLCVAISGFLLIILPMSKNLSGIIMLTLYTFIIEAVYTVYSAKLQHEIQSHARATITSVSFVMLELLSIGAYLVYGFVADKAGHLAAFHIFGWGVVVIALYTMLANRSLTRLHKYSP